MDRKQFILGAVSCFALYANGISIENMSASGRVAVLFTGVLQTGSLPTGNFIDVSGTKSPAYYSTSGRSMFFRER